MKKLTSIFLVLMLVLALLPLGVLAQEGEETLDSAEQSDTLLAESDTDESVEEANEPTEEVTEESTENTEETGEAEENTEEIAALSLDGVDADAATSGDCGADGDNLKWTLKNGTLTITGTGAMKDYEQDGDAPWFSQRESIVALVIKDGVTDIADYAFFDCISLVDVTIPESVISIGEAAFFGGSMTSVTIPDSVTSIGAGAFAWCVELTSVTLGSGITKIENDAFFDCVSLTSVTIPSGVTCIGSYAFSECTALTSIPIPASVTSIGKGAFGDCSRLKDVYYAGKEEQWNKIIVDSANEPLDEATKHFISDEQKAQIIGSGNCGANGDNLTWTLDVNGKLVINGRGAMANYYFSNNYYDKITPWFWSRADISSVVINDGVTSIGHYAFKDCSSLTSVTISSSVTSVGDSAFAGCSKLSGVALPDGLMTIWSGAFSNCSSLSEITIPSSVTSIGTSVFQGCSSLASITLPDSMTQIGRWMFKGCSALTDVTIPENVEEIGDRAFGGCTSLTNITIPNGVTYIVDGAFMNCSALTSVSIPASVTNIGGLAFYNCSALTSVEVDGDNADYCSDGGILFNKNKTILLQYPAGKRDASYVIPNSVTSIETYAFAGCTSLTSITIPNSVTSIAESAFYLANALTDVYFTGNETQWKTIEIDSDNDPLDKATKHFMSEEAEAEIVCSGDCGVDGGNLTWTLDVNGKLIISGKGKMADYEAYGPWHTKDSPKGEVNVRIVVIEVGVTSIGKNAFRDCRLIASVTIPETVTSIGEAAFYDCNSLESVTIPASVTSIGDFAFSNYGIEIGGLVSITVVSGNKNYHSDGGVLFNKNMTILLQYPTGKRASSYTIPSGVTSIGTYAFAGSNALASVTIPSSVKRIDEGAFSECSALTSVTIPSGVTSIGDFMFSGCGALTNLTIPSGVTSIGKYAFIGCDLLERVTIPASVTSIGESAFYLADALTDVYFTGSVTQWNEINPGGDNDPLANAAKHYGAQIKEDGSTSVTTVTEDKETGTKATTETTLVGDKTTNVTTTETKNAAGGTTTTVTKNVTDKANNVTTETKVNDNKRAETKAEFGEGGKTPSRVTVDATAPNPKDVTGAEVKLPAKALNDAAKEETGKVEQVELKTDVATVTIDNDALKTMTKDAEENEELILAVDKTDKTTDTDKGVYATYELTAKIGNEDVFKERNEEDNGFVTISVRYTLTNASYDVMVYYVDEFGQRHDMNARFEGGILTWVTSHFSTFEVVEQAKAAQPDAGPADSTKPAAKTTDAKKPPRTGDEGHAALWLAVALLGGCAVVGTTLIAKKKNYNQ